MKKTFDRGLGLCWVEFGEKKEVERRIGCSLSCSFDSQWWKQYIYICLDRLMERRSPLF